MGTLCAACGLVLQTHSSTTVLLDGKCPTEAVPCANCMKGSRLHGYTQARDAMVSLLTKPRDLMLVIAKMPSKELEKALSISEATADQQREATDGEA